MSAHPNQSLDPTTEPNVPKRWAATPDIDYFPRDYASFRQFMLDQLARTTPSWTERNPSDVGIVLVELLAQAGDYLSHYQEAVATEAHLGTARQRISIRRHLRLLDYVLHEGCNARVWIQIQVDGEDVPLPAGTSFLTAVPNQGTRILPQQLDRLAAACQAVVFQSMHREWLHRAHNLLPIHCWGLRNYALAAGTTGAALSGHIRLLRAGDVLILAQTEPGVASEHKGVSGQRYHPIRILNAPALTVDRRTGEPITEFRWHQADALPFRLDVSGYDRRGVYRNDATVALGNVVLADAGRTIRDEPLPDVSPDPRYTPPLGHPHLVFRAPSSQNEVRSWSAAASIRQEPRDAVAAVALTEERESGDRTWTVVADLFGCDRLARSFVAEVDNAGVTHLRFGDGDYGRRPSPGTRFRATYRVGGGAADEVGSDTIHHVVTADSRIVGVRNPLAATGATTAESVGSARRHAPQEVAARQSCVTADEYAAAARRHPGVSAATAWIDGRAGWNVVTIVVDRRDGHAVNADFCREIKWFLEPHRAAGDDLLVLAPGDAMICDKSATPQHGRPQARVETDR
jgi:hypothetical protein